MLTDAVKTGLTHQVGGSTIREVLDHLFEEEPGLRSHLVDEKGAIRAHVSVFVDGSQASLDSRVGHDASIRVLHAVSGGWCPQAGASRLASTYAATSRNDAIPTGRPVSAISGTFE